MWQYYYDSEKGETIYYHGGEKIAVLSGKETQWQNGVPCGKHLEEIMDVFQNSTSQKRIAMTYDLHLGFQEIDDPINT